MYLRTRRPCGDRLALVSILHHFAHERHHRGPEGYQHTRVRWRLGEQAARLPLLLAALPFHSKREQPQRGCDAIPDASNTTHDVTSF